MSHDDRDDRDDRDDDDLDISVGGGRGHSENIPNYLAQSILVTLCCCWPVGIAAIVNAAKVNSLVAQGKYDEARRASDQAKTYCWVSFVLGIIVQGVFAFIQIASMNQPGGPRF